MNLLLTPCIIRFCCLSICYFLEANRFFPKRFPLCCIFSTTQSGKSLLSIHPQETAFLSPRKSFTFWYARNINVYGVFYLFRIHRISSHLFKEKKKRNKQYILLKRCTTLHEYHVFLFHLINETVTKTVRLLKFLRTSKQSETIRNEVPIYFLRRVM